MPKRRTRMADPAHIAELMKGVDANRRHGGERRCFDICGYGWRWSGHTAGTLGDISKGTHDRAPATCSSSHARSASVSCREASWRSQSLCQSEAALTSKRQKDNSTLFYISSAKSWWHGAKWMTR